MAPKKPQDHKSAGETFVWTTPDGSTISLPPMTRIKAGIVRKHRHDEGEFIFAVLEDLADEDSLAAFDDLEMGDVNDLFAAWQAHGGASLGESSGSST